MKNIKTAVIVVTTTMAILAMPVFSNAAESEAQPMTVNAVNPAQMSVQQATANTAAQRVNALNVPLPTATSQAMTSIYVAVSIPNTRTIKNQTIVLSDTDPMGNTGTISCSRTYRGRYGVTYSVIYTLDKASGNITRIWSTKGKVVSNDIFKPGELPNQDGVNYNMILDEFKQDVAIALQYSKKGHAYSASNTVKTDLDRVPAAPDVRIYWISGNFGTNHWTMGQTDISDSLKSPSSGSIEVIYKQSSSSDFLNFQPQEIKYTLDKSTGVLTKDTAINGIHSINIITKTDPGYDGFLIEMQTAISLSVRWSSEPIDSAKNTFALNVRMDLNRFMV